jgi:hypothetical protein
MKKKTESIKLTESSELQELFDTMPSMSVCTRMANSEEPGAGPAEWYWVAYRCPETGAFSNSPQLLHTTGPVPDSYNLSVPAHSVRNLLDMYYKRSGCEENPETIHQVLADAVAYYVTDYLADNSELCRVNCYGSGYVDLFRSRRQTAISFEICQQLKDYVQCGVTEFVWTYEDVGAVIPKRVRRSAVGPINAAAIEPIRVVDAYTVDELYQYHMMPFDWELETKARTGDQGDQYQVIISKPRQNESVHQVTYRSRWFPAHVLADGIATFFMEIQKL